MTEHPCFGILASFHLEHTSGSRNEVYTAETAVYVLGALLFVEVSYQYNGAVIR